MTDAKSFHDVDSGQTPRTAASMMTTSVRPNDDCMQLSPGYRCPELPYNGLFRGFFLLSCGVQVAYLFYRLATFWRTMPSVLMFWAEMPVNFWHVISGMQRWTCRDVRKASPLLKNLAPAFSEQDWPEVTVLIPTLDESIETLTNTIAGCLQMDYPKKKLWIYCCDDGNRKALKARCDELGVQFGTTNVQYIARPKTPGVPHHAKAGNLNYALQEIGVHGDFIVCFDADMCPRPEFLQRTIPQFYEYDMNTNTFSDNKIALVQTPQVFDNVPKWDWLDNGQCVWYYSVLCGLDALDSVPFCGTNAVLRRSAIETLPNGGLPYGSLTEDLHTSLQLVLRGWSTRYVNRQLAVGCAPITLADAIDQRTRWCVGALQMIGIENIWSSNMSFMAKCAFWMLGGLTIYAFISFVVITTLSVLQVFLHTGWMLIVPCPTDQLCWLGYFLGCSNYILGFGHIMLSPGDVPLLNRWRFVSSFFTYMPCMMISLFVVGFDRPYSFKTTDKAGQLGKDYIGAFHKANAFHLVYALILLSTLTSIIMRFIQGAHWMDLFRDLGMPLFWVLLQLISMIDVMYTMIDPLPTQRQREVLDMSFEAQEKVPILK